MCVYIAYVPSVSVSSVTISVSPPPPVMVMLLPMLALAPPDTPAFTPPTVFAA